MNCPGADIFDRYYDGELSPAESQEFKKHIDSCVSCARKYQALEYTESALRKYRSFYKDAPAPDMLYEVLEKCSDELSVFDIFKSVFLKPQYAAGFSAAFVILIAILFYPAGTSEYRFQVPSSCRSGETAYIQYTAQNRSEPLRVQVYVESDKKEIKLCDYSAPVLIPGEKIQFLVPYIDGSTSQLKLVVQNKEFAVPLRIEDRVSFITMGSQNGQSRMKMLRNGKPAANMKGTLKTAAMIVPLNADENGIVVLNRELLANDFSVKMQNSRFEYAGLGPVLPSSGSTDAQGMAYYAGVQPEQQIEIAPAVYSSESLEYVEGQIEYNHVLQYRRPVLSIIILAATILLIMSGVQVFKEKKKLRSLYSDARANER